MILASDEPEATAYQLFLRSGLEAAGVASILGGDVSISSERGAGTRVEITQPPEGPRQEGDG